MKPDERPTRQRGCESGSCIDLVRNREGAAAGNGFWAMAARVDTPMMTLSVLHAVIPLWPPFRIVEPIKIIRTVPCDAMRAKGF